MDDRDLTLEQRLETALYADLGIDPDRVPVADGVEVMLEVFAELDTQIKVLKAERDALRADLDHATLTVALHGMGVDPNGYYAGTPGFRARQLLALERRVDSVVTQIERTGPNILRAWLEHRGYVPDEIDFVMSEPDHSLCEQREFGWFCEEDGGGYRHDAHLKVDEMAELITFVLDFPAGAFWTLDDKGTLNRSPLFLCLVDEVANLIRNDARNLLNGEAHLTAQLVLAQLAHVHGLAPVGPVEH